MQGLAASQPSPSPVWTTEKCAEEMARPGSSYGSSCGRSGREIHVDRLARIEELVAIRPFLRTKTPSRSSMAWPSKIAKVEELLGLLDRAEGEPELHAQELGRPVRTRARP